MSFVFQVFFVFFYKMKVLDNSLAPNVSYIKGQ